MSENERIPSDDYERELDTDLDDKTRDKPAGMALHTKILIGLLVGVIGGLAIVGAASCAAIAYALRLLLR